METDIIGYDGLYTITKEGDVYSYKNKKPRKLKPQKASQSKKGYYQVRLFEPTQDRKGTLYYVHRLVWETFVGDIQAEHQIDHINADTLNNSLDNLQVLTIRQNMKKYLNKKHKIDFRERRDELVQLYKKLGTYEKVAKEVGSNYQVIYRAIKDVVHTYDAKTGKHITRRYSDIDDEYTRTDLRKTKR